MFKWYKFREILLPSSGNVNDYVAQIFETTLKIYIERVDMSVFHDPSNMDNLIMRQEFYKF